MIATAELCSLPLPERLRLVEDLWNSIAEEQESLADHPAVIAELRVRKARLKTDPSSAIPWDEARRRIRSGCA
jgi:putative addiction module component (TIGR02574 family)